MKIFVENLTHSVAKNDLRKLFELWGEGKSITIKKYNRSGQTGGFKDIPNRLAAHGREQKA